VEGLHQEGVPETTIVALQNGPIETVPLTGKDKALLHLAERLTTAPATIGPAVRAAAAQGWSDTEVADAIFYVSHINMLSRIATAFGLPPDATHPYSPDSTLPMRRCGE
jgi:alkylhydroperoxidase family enzyme